MSKKKTYINRDKLASMVSTHTGYTKDAVIEIMAVEDLITAELLAKGYSIKRHKLFRLDVETRAEKNAYNGIDKKHFTLPQKEYVKFIPLIGIKNALNELNDTIDK